MLCARLGRRPWLGPIFVDDATATRFAAAADSLLGGEDVDVPRPRLDFLRWLATNRAVVFHGSQRGDLTELSTARQSKDSTEWGNQQAVYATTDPVWAVYFATLRRDNGFNDTCNGTIGVAGGPLYPRTYFFVHNRGSASPDRFGPGNVYVLRPDTFASGRPRHGFDTAHLVSHEPVVPLARVDVEPEDFPFRHRIGYSRDGEPLFVTLLRG